MTLALTTALSALAVAVFALTLVYSRRPRADRDWAPDHAVPARVSLSGGEARIERLRDFRHALDGSFTEGYRDESVRLADVQGVWLAVAPFSERWQALAHVFLSFELAGGRCISVSVEARRRRGQPYSVIGGFLRRFEVTYVVGTEPDLLGARAGAGEKLLLYPLRATPEQSRRLFEDMLRGAEARRGRPAFYHSVTHNCATVLREHVNRVLPRPLPFGVAVLLPGYADRAVLEQGLLDTDLPLEAARARHRVDGRVRAALAEGRDGAEFSLWVRQMEAREALPRRPGAAGVTASG
jgi:hypothetical protein